MKTYPVKFEVREDAEGWRLFALPCHGVGWAPIAMTPASGTPGGALVEFASALYRLTENEKPDPKIVPRRAVPGPFIDDFICYDIAPSLPLREPLKERT